MNQREQNVLEIQHRIGYSFNNPELLIEALSHSSYVNERKLNRSGSYERLEFLGDAVLETVSSTVLYKLYPQMNEGSLSKLRASLVCEKALAPCARRIQLGECILLGHGETVNHGEQKDSILSDVIEAVIGAIYLDGGFERAYDFISRFILNNIDGRNDFTDYKTMLQEIVQADGPEQVEYEIIDLSGPDHDRTYTARVTLKGRVIGTGTGKNKKAAEQNAAQQAVANLK